MQIRITVATMLQTVNASVRVHIRFVPLHKMFVTFSSDVIKLSMS